MPLGSRPSRQIVACALGVLVERDARGGASASLTHGRKLAGARSGKTSARLPMSPFGSSTSAGMPASSASSIRHDGEARLARARHADDDAVGREVAGADDDPVGARLARLRVEREAEVEGAAVGHRAASL